MKRTRAILVAALLCVACGFDFTLCDGDQETMGVLCGCNVVELAPGGADAQSYGNVQPVVMRCLDDGWSAAADE